MLSAPSTYSTRTCPILRKDRMSESADNGNSMQGSPQANICPPNIDRKCARTCGRGLNKQKFCGLHAKKNTCSASSSWQPTV